MAHSNNSTRNLDLTSQQFHSESTNEIVSDRLLPARTRSTGLDQLEKPTTQFENVLADNLLGSKQEREKVLSFKRRCPPSLQTLGNFGVVYNEKENVKARTQVTRVIPQAPKRALDAPGLINDFYCNVVDWSCQNIVAVVLGESVYTYNGSTGETTVLCQLPSVSSVKWSADGQHLAIGNDEYVSLWDVERKKVLRKLRSHSARIPSLSWNEYLLSSGSKDSEIHNSDLRISNHLVNRLVGHEGEVCGLEWCPDNMNLASGSNDNLVMIWDKRCGDRTAPKHVFRDNLAAVKALAWCPWQSNLLATGSGTADRRIRIWDSKTGVCRNSIDTGSQVCGLQWGVNDKELISGHGFSQNQLTLWKYPTFSKIQDIYGNEGRVLSLCLSPDKTTVLSASADEILRFWDVFSHAPPPAPKVVGESKLEKTIR